MSAVAPLVDPPPAGGGLAITASDPQAIPPPQTLVPANMQLSRNPMLPAHPLGAYTDSQYEAQDAILRNTIAKQYADLLQKLGYRDEAGNFIQGSVETEANKQNQLLQRQQQLAREGVTQDAQRNGILFSGMRGTLQARAEEPYVNQISDLAAATPLTIQQLYENASGLTNDYVLGQNQELADAASRAAASITANPPGAGGGGTGTGGVTPSAGAGADVTPTNPFPDQTDALVPVGVNVPQRPGITLIQAPQAQPVPVIPPQQQAAAALPPNLIRPLPGQLVAV